nr:MAG TPA: YtxH-like protein [Caudoviricetes sp.]
MIFMLVTLVPCLLVGFGLGAGLGYKLGEQDEKERLKRNSERYEKR